MSDVDEKLDAIDDRFRRGSKQWEAARFIVRKNRLITTDERKAMCKEIPMKPKTLQGLFTELRKMGLYPPQKNSELSDRIPDSEKPEEPSHHASEETQIEYATVEDLNLFRKELLNVSESLRYLTNLISGDRPPDWGGYPVEEGIEAEEGIEIMEPGEIIIQDGSFSRESLYLKPKTRMYYDMAREGVFGNYAGTKEPGPFTNFKGSMSDFFNIIVDDYFIRNYYAEIGLTMTRFPR